MKRSICRPPPVDWDLEIEITPCRSPAGEAEQISIDRQAVLSFEAFGRFCRERQSLARAEHRPRRRGTLVPAQCPLRAGTHARTRSIDRRFGTATARQAF